MLLGRERVNKPRRKRLVARNHAGDSDTKRGKRHYRLAGFLTGDVGQDEQDLQDGEENRSGFS